MQLQHKLTPFIWYQSGAEDAVAHYLRVFGADQSRVLHTQHWGENSPGPAGGVMLQHFELLGLQMTAFNGGPYFKLNESFSLTVACADQAEIDHLWEQLPAGGGQAQACGWVKDAWGLHWQIIPAQWFSMIRDPDAARVQRVFQALWTMHKIDLAALQRAYDGTDMSDARTLATERLLPAPPKRVWQAFADPAQLARWWGPEGFTNEFETCDFREGGAWRSTMIGPDGARYANESRFGALLPRQRIVVDHVSPPRFVLTVTLEAEGGGTRVGWSQCFETAELRQALQAICIPANEQNLDRLARVLAAGAP